MKHILQSPSDFGFIQNKCNKCCGCFVFLNCIHCYDFIQKIEHYSKHCSSNCLEIAFLSFTCGNYLGVLGYLKSTV